MPDLHVSLYNIWQQASGAIHQTSSSTFHAQHTNVGPIKLTSKTNICFTGEKGALKGPEAEQIFVLVVFFFVFF